MSTNIKTAMVDGGGTGSGVLVDITTSVTLNQANDLNATTRIFALYADVAGVYQISGDKQQVAQGGASASAGIGIKFKAVAGADIYLGDYGPRFRGTVKVSAPSSGAVITAFYG
jgi:hypothetical protein